jgi:hypothetical protein
MNNTLGAEANWASIDSGRFGTDDPADKIAYQIQHGAVNAAFISFRLVLGAHLSWWKGIQPPGDESRIQAYGRRSAAEGVRLAPQIIDAHAQDSRATPAGSSVGRIRPITRRR